MLSRETQALPSASRRPPGARPTASSEAKLAAAIGNAQMARLAQTGTPAELGRGASPATGILMRAASLSKSSGARLDRCGAGCGCASCADEELEEDGLKPN
jgi:hypothetical protein